MNNEFVKIYDNKIVSLSGIIIEDIISIMPWAHAYQYFHLTGFEKGKMASSNNLSRYKIDSILKSLVKEDVLRKHPEYRGSYKINPFVIAKGEDEDILKIREDWINEI